MKQMGTQSSHQIKHENHPKKNKNITKTWETT
jgi:hypothetical protein